MKCFVFIILIQFLPLFGSSQQEHPILNYFNVNLVSNKVFLNWEIQGGNQCNGINIFRSSDGLNFENIGDIQGVCGGGSTPESYSFTDNSPLNNSYNYYRIELGNQGFSSTDSVLYVSLNEHGYNILRDVDTKLITVKVNNSSSKELMLELYNINGQKLRNINSYDGEFFQIDLNSLNSGIYIFRIFGDSVEIKGEFLY